MLPSRNKIFWENLVSLYVVQAANYILPLISFPYLVRVLGIERFGLLSFAFALIQYFVIVTDYGFNLTATRQISRRRDDPGGLAEIFWTTMTVKFYLMLICLLALILILTTVQRFRQDAALYAVYFFSVVGNLIFPVWFLQGLERMKIISLINLISKILSTAALFILIRQPGHLVWVAAIQSGGVLLSGLLCLAFVLANYSLPLRLPTMTQVKASLADGWPVFVTMLSSSMINNTMVFVLGLFAPNRTVGLFSIAEKIARLGINFVGPVSVALFPRASSLFDASYLEAVRFLRKALAYGTIPFMLIALALFAGADLLVYLISGSNDAMASRLLRIMSLLPLTIFIDNIYGTQVLLNIKKERQFMLAVTVPGILSLAVSFLVVPRWHAYATAVVFLAAEVLILMLMILATRKAECYLVKDGWL